MQGDREEVRNINNEAQEMKIELVRLTEGERWSPPPVTGNDPRRLSQLWYRF